MMVDRTTTRWPLVFALVAAGVICAFQVAKAAIAVPLLRLDLGLSLSAASWVVSAYGALGAIAGLAVGVFVPRIGARRVAIAGLFVLGAASCIGAAAPNGAWLMASRVLESFGYIPVVIATPTLLRLVSAPRDRDIVMAIWSCYVPIGMVTLMLAGPWLVSDGWRILWIGNGVLALAYAAVIAMIAPRESVAARHAASQAGLWASVRTVLGSPGAMLLAGAFGLYAFHYHAVIGLMPTLLVERLHLSIEAAGPLVAAIIVINGVGNLIPGWLLRAGVPLWSMLALSFTVIALMSFGIFSEAMPAGAVVAFAAASIGISGLLPGTVFAGAPRYTPRPELLALTLGVVVQAANIGQFLGPAALGGWADHFGWESAPLLVVAIAAIGLAASLGLRNIAKQAATR